MDTVPKRTWILASRNAHKAEELAAMLTGQVRVKPLPAEWAGIEIPEEEETFEGNSASKALFVWERLQTAVLADDSGIEVYALNGAPGVHSARYSPSGKDGDNLNLLLQKMEGAQDRRARFRCVISLMEDGILRQFEGKVEGRLALAARGKDGFGYDPIFIPDGFDETFSELGPDVKNAISHRGRAVEKLIEYLNNESKVESLK